MENQKMTADEYCQKIIDRIIFLMEKKNLKQLDLAARSNISQSSLSKILKGEMRLTLQHIFKICTSLEIAPENLLAFGTELSDDFFPANYTAINETGLFNEQYMNEEIFIRDRNHPAFNGIKNNTFHIYLYSTIASESFLLNGTITFDATKTSFCKAEMTLYTGKTDTNGEPQKKVYSGELIISLTMGACYCVLTNPTIGEICFLNFRHMYLFNQGLECRVGTISSTSSGGNRLPVVQRILISRQPLDVKGEATSDLEFVQGQLRLNNSKMLISKVELEALISDYVNNTDLSNFFKKFQASIEPVPYYPLDEANIKTIPVTSDIKTEGLGILRNISSALRYNKVSTKTDEFVFEYICNKKN